MFVTLFLQIRNWTFCDTTWTTLDSSAEDAAECKSRRAKYAKKGNSEKKNRKDYNEKVLEIQFNISVFRSVVKDDAAADDVADPAAAADNDDSAANGGDDADDAAAAAADDDDDDDDAADDAAANDDDGDNDVKKKSCIANCEPGKEEGAPYCTFFGKRGFSTHFFVTVSGVFTPKLFWR